MQKSKMLFSSGLLIAMIAVLGAAQNTYASFADNVTGELYSMKALYTTEYAPADWKKTYAGYDLQTNFNAALAAVNANPLMSVKDSRAIFKNFIYAMKDYHTSISFISTEVARLPLEVGLAAGHVYIVNIDRDKLSQISFPYNVGDEIVSLDGVPSAQVIANIQAQIPANVPETDQALATLRFFSRKGAGGIDVPQGAATLEILPQGATASSQVQLVWDYTPEKISAAPVNGLSIPVLSQNLNISGFHQYSKFNPEMSVRLDVFRNDDLVNRSADDAAPYGPADPFGIGNRKTFTPDLGAKIWESDSANHFYAYIFKSDSGKMIGYIRLPQYEVDDYPKAVQEFTDIVGRFQGVTDAMIIDQVNNPGGSVFYLYALAATLTDQPLATPRHQMSLTQDDVNQAYSQIAALKDVKSDADAQKAISADDGSGYPITYEFAMFMKNAAQFVVDQWNSGKRLTDPYWIGGVDHINPAATHYSKPILLVINHLDFSGGDFFPATMQDNKRVTVFGSRTAGAGGVVADIPLPNAVGVDSFRCTESIAHRAGNEPIENLGVTPDVPYEMTPADYQQNFAPYAKAMLNAVNSIIK